jgi:hypothetical protein
MIVSYVILNLLSRTSPLLDNIGEIYAKSGISFGSPKYIKTNPSVSLPLLPAHPAIYIYSPELRSLNPFVHSSGFHIE